MFNSGHFQVLLLQSRVFGVISLKMVHVLLVNASCCNQEAPEILGFPGEGIRLQCGRPGSDPWVGKIPWRRERLPTPVFWPGELHGL